MPGLGSESHWHLSAKAWIMYDYEYCWQRPTREWDSLDIHLQLQVTMIYRPLAFHDTHGEFSTSNQAEAAQ